jgi:hypothetical protein
VDQDRRARVGDGFDLRVGHLPAVDGCATVEEALETVGRDQAKRFLGRMLLVEIDKALPSDVLSTLVGELVEASLHDVAAHLVALAQSVTRARALMAREED